MPLHRSGASGDDGVGDRSYRSLVLGVRIERRPVQLRPSPGVSHHQIERVGDALARSGGAGRGGRVSSK